MSNEFKIGSIADLINSKASPDKSSPKKTKMAKKFGEIIAQNKNRVIEIKKEERLEQLDMDNHSKTEGDNWKIDVTPMDTNKSGRNSVKKNKKRKSEDNLETKKNKKSNHLNQSQIKAEEDEEEDKEDDVLENEDNEEADSDVEETSSRASKTERTIFVGNLPVSFTQKRLKKLFNKYGIIQSVRLRGAVPQDLKTPKKVAMITKKLHQSVDSIKGYVVFKSKDDVSKALKMNGTVVDGHHIRVDTVSDNEKTQSYDNQRTIFVGNLPFVTKDDELFEFFQECGDIEAVRVIRDTKTGVGKGIAFILFKSKDSVILALEKNEKEFKGRELRVKRIENNKSGPKKKRIDSDLDDRQRFKHTEKKTKKSDTKSGFGGIAAKKLKKKIKKKKEIKTLKAKKKQKSVAQIFAK